jgi:hypothetical protein
MCMQKEHQNFDEEAIHIETSILHEHLTELRAQIYALIDSIEDLHIDRRRLSADMHRWHSAGRQVIEDGDMLTADDQPSGLQLSI